MLKQVFNKKSNRVIAGLLTIMIIFSTAVFALNNTMAAPEVITIPQPNSYPTVEKGATMQDIIQGLIACSSGDITIATVKRLGTGTMEITGVKAGIAAISVNSAVYTAVLFYQIMDSNNISQYTLRDKGEVILNVGKTKNVPVDIPAGKNPVAWTTSNNQVALVSSTGVITGQAKGIALIIGEFTDKWGVKQHIHILVGVETPLSNSLISALMDAIKKGEAITGLDPSPYESVAALQAAINAAKGILDQANPTDDNIQNAINGINTAINNLKLKTGQGDDVIIGVDGNNYKKVPGHKNIYEKLDANGKSKYPPEYIYSPNDTPGSATDRPAYPEGNDFRAEDEKGSNIWLTVKPDGTLDGNDAIWGGPNLKPGGNDDKPVQKFGNYWWINMGQNVWRRVNGANNLGPLAGGGPAEDPSQTPVYEIFDNTAKDGKYYIGQLGPDNQGNYYYIGDKPVSEGGDGKLNSAIGYTHATDQKYYRDSNNNMSTTPPQIIGTVTFIGLAYPKSIEKGTSAYVEATVYGTGGIVSQDVTWTLTGANKPGTKINSNGLVTVAIDETSPSLKITATSVAAPSISASANIAIHANLIDTGNGIPGLYGRAPGSIVKIDDLEWVVVKYIYAYNAQRYVALLLLNDVIYPESDPMSYRDTYDAIGNGDPKSNPAIKINGWYTALKSPMLKKYALNPGCWTYGTWFYDNANPLPLAGNKTDWVCFPPGKSDIFPALSTAQLQLSTPQNPASSNKLWWTSSLYNPEYGTLGHYLDYVQGNGTWAGANKMWGRMYARPAIYVIAD